MRPILLILLSLMACSGDDEASQNPDGAQQAQTQAEKGPSPLDKAKSLVAARNHEQAIPALEALLPKSEGDALFVLLRLEALAAGQAGAVLDRLDANTALPGHEREHHRLRAELALAAGRANDALAAADKLGEIDAEEGAVLRARAVRAGAPLPGGLDPNNPAHALLIASTTSPLDPAALTALAVQGWRARVLRAELRAELGDQAGAQEDLSAALATGEAAAVLEAAPRLASLSGDASNNAEHLSSAARAALELGFPSAAAEYGARAALLRAAGLQVEAASKAAAELRELVATAGDVIGAATLDDARALVALESGAAAEALTLAKDAATKAKEAQQSALTEHAAWVWAQAAWSLGLDDSLNEAAALLPAAQKPTAEALRLILLGHPEQALATPDIMRQLPNLDGDPEQAFEQLSLVRIHLAWARAAAASGRSAADHTRAAVSAADLLGLLPARIESRLEQDRYARQQGESNSALTELEQLAATLSAPAPLLAEVAARKALSGQAAALPTEGAGADAAAWAGVIDPAALPATADPKEHVVIAWARARAALKGDDLEGAAKLVFAALSRAPVHHRGPWAPISVLPGNEGLNEALDLAGLHDKAGSAPAQAALMLHDRWHGAQAMDRAFALGDDPSMGLPAEERSAYNQAHLQLRAATLRWFSGVGAEPTEASAALAAADTKALENKSFARALPAPLADPSTFGDRLKGTAVLSYRMGPGQGEAVLLSATSGRVLPLKDTDSIRRQADALGAALESGIAQGGDAVSPKPGDILRRLTIDIFQEDLAGLGRYLILPDGPLRDLSFSALPEQQSGLRFLADIRSIAVLPTASELLRAPGNPPERYVPDYLGIDASPLPTGSGPESRMATEVEATSRQFSPENTVRERGPKANAELFKTQALNARFLHLSGLKVGDRAALGFSEGQITLAELRGMDLTGTIALLSMSLPVDVRERWVHALRAAGVGTVVSTAWQVNPDIGGRIAYRFFETVAQDRSPAMALAESQGKVRADENNVHFDPSWWSQYLLHGSP